MQKLGHQVGSSKFGRDGTLVLHEELLLRFGYIPGSAASGDATEDDAVQKGIPTKAVFAMHTTHGFPCDVEARDDLVVLVQAL
jgi:hypothetical protein